MTLTGTKHTAGRSKRAKAAKQLTPAELFFYDHAGYSYDPKTEKPEDGRIRCAKSLARAEAYAQEHEWRYSWLWDESPDLSWMTPEELEQEHEVLGCILMTPDDANAQSLWGITDPDSNYRRVVEAELAAEEMPEDIRRENARAESIRHMNE